MKKSIVSFIILSIAAGLVLTQSSFAADDNPNDPNQHKGAAAKGAAAKGAAQSGKGQAQTSRPVAHAAAAPARVAQVQQPVTRKNANPVAGRSAVTNSQVNPRVAKHTVASHPATATSTNTQAIQSRGARTVRTNTNNYQPQAVSGASGITGRSGGGKFTRANNYGGRWTAGNNHTDWNQGQEHDWDGHHYRWYDGGWLIIDGGFWPVPVYQGGGSLMVGAQQQLANDGYYHGPIDGIPGPGTRQAIANYQSDNSLPVTGHLNIPTQQSLGLD